MLSRLKYHICLILLLSAIWSAHSFAAININHTILIEGSDGYPPFEFINDNGEPAGFNVDIVKAVMEDLGITDYVIKLDNWDKVKKRLENKEIDMVIGMIYNSKAIGKINFSIPICAVQRGFVTKYNTKTISNIADLKGKKIVIMDGGWSYSYLKDQNITDNIVITTSIQSGLELVNSGKCDAFVGNSAAFDYVMNKKNMYRLILSDMNINTQQYSIAVNENNDELLYNINIALSNLTESGKYQEIHDKWFIRQGYGFSTTYLYIILITFIIIASLILFTIILRRRVKKATLCLSASEEELNLAIDAGEMSAWAYYIDSDRFHMIRGTVPKQEGFSLDALLNIISDADRPIVEPIVNDLIRQHRQIANFTFWTKIAGDTPKRCYEVHMKYFNKHITDTKVIIGTLKDITTEIISKKRLEKTELKSRLIIQASEITLFQYNVGEKMFFKLDDNGKKMSGRFSTDEYLQEIHPDDVNTLKSVFAGMDSQTEKKVSSEYRMREPMESEYHWYSFEAFAYTFNKEGLATKYIGMRRNNDKWHKMKDDVIVLRDKAEASNKLKSVFLANMSHEIRTPLNAIVGFSDLIISTDDPDEKQEYMEIIQSNNQLLLQLINDILDLSKIESGFVDFKYTTFQFADFIKQTATSLSFRAPSGVSLICETPFDIKINTDKTRLSQILTNFITNACKFTTQGNITLSYTLLNEGIKISVADTGIGIPPEMQAKVFERFEKLNTFAQGFGLGLSICKALIEAMNGSIGVESEVGKGSTFWIWVPLNTEPGEIEYIPADSFSSEIFTTTPHIKEERPEFVPGKPLVLVAEDLQNNFLLAEKILQKDYNIIHAVDGDDAINKAKVQNPDIILMDMKMPNKDGLEATRAIRSFNKEVPIIALTAYVLDTDKETALKAGCNGYLTKPLRAEALSDALKDVSYTHS